MAELRERYRADVMSYMCTYHTGCNGGAYQSFGGTATTGATGDPDYDFLHNWNFDVYPNASRRSPPQPVWGRTDGMRVPRAWDGKLAGSFSHEVHRFAAAQLHMSPAITHHLSSGSQLFHNLGCYHDGKAARGASLDLPRTRVHLDSPLFTEPGQNHVQNAHSYGWASISNFCRNWSQAG